MSDRNRLEVRILPPWNADTITIRAITRKLEPSRSDRDAGLIAAFAVLGTLLLVGIGLLY